MPPMRGTLKPAEKCPVSLTSSRRHEWVAAMKSGSALISRGDARRRREKKHGPPRPFDPWQIARWISIAVIAVGGFLLVRTLPTAALLERGAETVEGLGSWAPIA